jgi:hypothetical protein
MTIRTAGRTAELSWDSGTHVPADKTIRCRRDYIIVEPLAVDHCVPFIVVEHTKPLRGIVKAVGPGTYPKRYDHPDKHRRTKTWDSRTFLPTEVKPGDVVELGGYEYGGYAFQTFMWGDVMHVICRELDVSGVVELPDPRDDSARAAQHLLKRGIDTTWERMKDDPRIDFYRTADAA